MIRKIALPVQDYTNRIFGFYSEKSVPKNRKAKRAFDLTFGFLLLISVAPLLALIALIIRLDGGPALFGHLRLGADGKSFRCWKFRSMVVNADDVLQQLLAQDARARQEWNRDFKLRVDPRITGVGRLLRKTSLDELPQLFNVVAGNMSLVGPRPIIEAEKPQYGPAFQAYCTCRPGITGLWQVGGRNDVDYSKRVQLDQRYAQDCTFRLDFTILLKTMVMVIRAKGAY